MAKKLNQTGYSSIPQANSPRMTEAWALIEAARRIAVALQDAEGRDMSDPKVRAALREPLRLNWRLWTIFQAELLREDTDLPEDIRVNMLTLCNYVDKHTVKCISQPTAENIAGLIDINRNIASGLMQNAPDENALNNVNEQSGNQPPADYKPVIEQA
ncbi:MAG: flagellar biosynthesis regulator FlaF [Magnetovibrio sp.]|nr:flagellar biosynthesis regulator FlaF [Magnetovibrio sp.]